MASNRRIRIPVEFDAPAVEIIPIMAVDARSENSEGRGGVGNATRRQRRLRVGSWRRTRRQVRGRCIQDAFRTDAVEAGRCGRFTAGTGLAGEMSNDSELLPV
jgi:hypothetical protein